MLYMFIIVSSAAFCKSLHNFQALFSSYGFALILSLSFEVPVMHLDKILFGGGDSRRRATNASSGTTNADGQNGTKKADLAEFQSPTSEELIEENGAHQPEQRKPLLEEKEQSV
jgi:hypothetical protein